VRGTVFVRARGLLDETRTLLEIAAVTLFVLGVVGWVDLRGDVEGALDVPTTGISRTATSSRWSSRALACSRNPVVGCTSG
jgi:hypothetical protein